MIALVGSLGEVKERIKYDPWGQKKSFDLEQSNGPGLIKSNRGYTGHDHMDSIGLIHMKGRVYDPSIGRFLSADPHIQDPQNLQSFNRYSYVWNNPLSATDPSGYFTWSIHNVSNTISKGFGDANNAINKAGRDLGGTGRKLNAWVNQPQNQRLVASIAIATLAAVAAPAAATWALQYGSWASWAAGTAVSGAGGYISGYVASDGNLEYSRKSALTAMAFYTVGSSFPSEGKMTAGMRVAKVAAHGVVGGFSSLNSGGTFESGFLATAASEAMTTFGGYNSVASGLGVNSQSLAYSTISASLVGGSISEWSGGSFESGAITAAMGRLFNEEAHKFAKHIQYYMWIEGPSSLGSFNEPIGHLSLSIGDPVGNYNSYSFGLMSASPLSFFEGGYVYRDEVSNGPILADSIVKLDENSYQEVRAILESKVGQNAPYYVLTGNCRTWTQSQFDSVKSYGTPTVLPLSRAANESTQNPWYFLSTTMQRRKN